MHLVLLISELVREVCGALDQFSLSALARTCRALHDPALDELWKDLYTLYPFVHLLTHSEEHQTPGWSPTPTQWATLRKYSARTRSLYVCIIDDLPLCFPSLCNPPDPNSFFPNIRTVAWYPDNHLAMLPFLRLLCGPTLTSLSAEFATDVTSLTVVAHLGMLCPNITDISISASTETLSDDLANTLSVSICHWNNLRHVSCDDLTFPALEHLGRSKNLESLTTCASVRMSSFSPSLGLPGFSRLRRLHLYTGQLSMTTACLVGLRLALEEFRLDLFDVEDVSTPSSLRDLSAALAKTCSPHLTRLYFAVVHPRFPSPGAHTTLHDLSPLLVFSRLRVVCLEGFSALSLDDDDIAVLASAWPHIESLALTTFVDHPVASLPTLRSLFQLVRACPYLRTLALVVDATKSVPPACLCTDSNVDPNPVRSDRLEDLCLGNSPIDAPKTVARVLRWLYPALKQVDMSVWNKAPLDRLPRRDRYETRWGLVNIELRKARAGGDRSAVRCHASGGRLMPAVSW